MATVNGTPVNFGFTGTNGITITGLTGLLLQSADYTKNADMEEIKDGDGDVVTVIFSNQNEEASLEFVVTDATNIAGAITNTTVSTPGAIIVISACASMPSLVQTNWIVQSGGKISGTNTTAKRITLPIKRYAGVTAVAS